MPLQILETEEIDGEENGVAQASNIYYFTKYYSASASTPDSTSIAPVIINQMPSPTHSRTPILGQLLYEVGLFSPILPTRRYYWSGRMEGGGSLA